MTGSAHAATALPRSRRPKQVVAGTHRTCPPEETWERIRGRLPRAGITRLADLTYLDDLGVPVYQAVRPNSKNMSTSQGKGITPLLAKVSAAMEALELWHAEDPVVASVRATVEDLGAELPYRTEDLNLLRRNLFSASAPLAWFCARGVSTGHPSYVPVDYVRLDFTVRREWDFPVFRVTSNGLASGNTTEEATLHALLEVVERDALGRMELHDVEPERLLPADVDGPVSRDLVERLRTAGTHVAVTYVPSPTGIPVFHATVCSEDLPVHFAGSGCHLDGDVSLSRALTEAVQSRLTAIAGTRDDLVSTVYAWAHSPGSGTAATDHQARSALSWSDVPSLASDFVDDDMHCVAARITDATGTEPLVVDLTSPDVDVPVVKVVAPGLLFEENH